MQIHNSPHVVPAFLLSDGDAFSLTFQQIRPLELVDRADHHQHQFARGRARVDAFLVGN